MLGIGDRFPEFSLTALVPGDLTALDAKTPDDYFMKVDSSSYEGKWRVVFFWPKDFTFICPTEIAEFGRAQHRVRRPRRAGARGLCRQRVRPLRMAYSARRSEEAPLPDALDTQPSSRVRPRGAQQ